MFFAAVLVTILTTKEYPPDDMEEFEAMKRDRSGVGHAFKEIFIDQTLEILQPIRKAITTIE